ncbi:MAG: DNA-processing protein DprA [Synergistaceae bacterium]|nr:DNA-processing protein DprA [Synergistaceae bacterium]MBR0249780.1 DNA-processing protein DprA [Synergistaceae bacterium]
MNAITKAALIFNAAKIPLTFFNLLCDSYSPDELFTHESILHELGLNDSQRQRIEAFMIKDAWPERELERTEKLNARFIHARDLDYPAKLKDLSNPPIGLYVRGNVNLMKPSVAVVGTRKPGDYARVTANRIGRELAKKNIITISGGARGIDAEGHRGTLAEDGVTVAVFGTGIDKIYPAEHRDLFNRILYRGALISEYPFNTSGEAWHFSERNRIIAAMSSRIIIVESPEDGGALRTAAYGFKLRRDVYAVPGRINDDTCRGSNKLISQGAKILFDIDEFINDIAFKPEQLNFGFDDLNTGHEVDNAKDNVNNKTELDDDEKLIYSLIQTHNEITADNLADESKLDLLTVQSALISLMSEGLVSENSGRYSVRV